MEEQTGSPGANTDNSSQRNGEEVTYWIGVFNSSITALVCTSIE